MGTTPEQRGLELRAQVARDAKRARALMWSLLLVPIALLIGWSLRPASDPTPASCQSATDTPCLTSEGTVRMIEPSGAYQFWSLSDWRDAKASAEQDGVVPPYGPGPNAP
jgi:hypothetical protein